MTHRHLRIEPRFAPRSRFPGATAVSGIRQPRTPLPLTAEIQTAPRSLGGNEQIAARYGAYARHGADSIQLAASSLRAVSRSHHLGARNDGASNPFPSRSAGRSPLERGEIAQALIDVARVVSIFALISVTGVGSAFAVFIMLFVDLH